MELNEIMISIKTFKYLNFLLILFLFALNPSNKNNLTAYSYKLENNTAKMKLYVKDAGEIELYSDVGNDTTLITKFSKKGWGIWNIKGWYIVHKPYSDIKLPYMNSSLLAGEDTDWEYVLRAVNPENNLCYFSGGNHANENLENIAFIDTANNKSIDIIPGNIKDIGKLNIVERTALNVKELNVYNYANVERNYIFDENKITLSTKFTFVKDMYLGTSYVAMFPVLKDYGQYCKFEGNDTIFNSPKQGFSDTTEDYENFIGKVDTLSTVLWGDKNPKYKFKVWIDNKEMVDNFNNSLKVFLWDVNKFGNKLYYSKYETADAKKISAGTEWNNSEGWEFVREK